MEPMAHARRPAPADPYNLPVDDAGHLVEDVVCLSCGYNLRGLSLRSACPECGTPMLQAVHGNYLRYSDPRWIQRLATGANILARSLRFVILLVIVMIIGPELPEFRQSGLGGDSSILVPALIGMLICTGLVSVVGIWLLTTPEREDRPHPSDKLVRRFARASVLQGPALAIVVVSLSQGHAGIERIESHLCVICLCVPMIVVSYHLRGLSVRLQDRWLSLRWLGAGVGGAILLLIEVAFLILLLVGGILFSGQDIGYLLVMLFIGVLSVVVFVDASDDLRKQLRRTVGMAAGFHAALCSERSAWRKHGGFGIDLRPLSGDPDARGEREQPSNKAKSMERTGS